MRSLLSSQLAERFNLAAKQGKVNGADLRRAGGWLEMKDAQHNLTYFYNNSSQLYRWSEPAEFEEEGADTNSDWFDAQDTESLVANSGPTGRDIGFWKELAEQDVGETFYAHKLSGEVRWSLSPRSAFNKGHVEEPKPEVEELVEEEEVIIGLWARVVDTSGVFYFNDETEESQWDPPQEFIDAGYTE